MKPGKPRPPAQKSPTAPAVASMPRARRGRTPDPAHILDKAIYQLWETINDLDQIQPERVEHYRVSIFGSSRIRRGDPIYDEVKKLSYELARMGADIVTGGGPGLMEAANAGARGRADRQSRAFLRPGHPSADRGEGQSVRRQGLPAPHVLLAAASFRPALLGVHRHAGRHRNGAGALHGLAAPAGQARHASIR